MFPLSAHNAYSLHKLRQIAFGFRVIVNGARDGDIAGRAHNLTLAKMKYCGVFVANVTSRDLRGKHIATFLMVARVTKFNGNTNLLGR